MELGLAINILLASDVELDNDRRSNVGFRKSNVDMCQDPKKIRDRSPRPGILEHLGTCIFIFSRDLRDLGSSHGNTVVGF